MNEFCIKYNCQFLRRIRVDFPNGKTKFLDVKRDEQERWRDVWNKLKIGKKQKVLFCGKEQEFSKPLLELYVEQGDISVDYLKLTVVQD